MATATWYEWFTTTTTTLVNSCIGHLDTAETRKFEVYLKTYIFLSSTKSFIVFTVYTGWTGTPERSLVKRECTEEESLTQS